MACYRDSFNLFLFPLCDHPSRTVLIQPRAGKKKQQTNRNPPLGPVVDRHLNSSPLEDKRIVGTAVLVERGHSGHVIDKEEQCGNNDRLCGLVVRVPGCRTEMCCASCEVRTEFIYLIEKKLDRLCGLVVRVPGYRSRGPGTIPGTTIFSEK
jgi:hypothetical protein